MEFIFSTQMEGNCIENSLNKDMAGGKPGDKIQQAKFVHRAVDLRQTSEIMTSALLPYNG